MGSQHNIDNFADLGLSELPENDMQFEENAPVSDIPFWDQGLQGVDPIMMQNNPFALNTAATSAPFNHEAAFPQGVFNPSLVDQGLGYMPMPYGPVPPVRFSPTWPPQYTPDGQQRGVPSMNQMLQQQPVWQQPPHVQDRFQRYPHQNQPARTRGRQQPVLQHGQQLVPQLGQQPAPQLPSLDQLKEKLKEPAKDEFELLIKSFDEAGQLYDLYLSLGDVDPKPLENIQGREAELIGRLYSAIRYAVRDAEGPEAEDPASGPGGQGQRKRKRTSTKSQIDAAISRKSQLELQLVCFQMVVRCPGKLRFEYTWVRLTY